MLTELDDYLCHQTVDAIELPGTSDRRAHSRAFITFYDTAGDFVCLTGIGNYLNTRVQDGFAVIAPRGAAQRSLRVSRMIDHDPHVMRIGPVAVEMIEPLRSFRLVCDENDLGFSWDVVCETIAPPWEKRRRFRPRVGGRVQEVGLHVNQAYRCHGTLVLDGERHELDRDRWFGVRDRGWGVGRFWEGDQAYTARNPAVAQPLPESFAPTDRGPYGAGDLPVGGSFVAHNSWVPFVDGGPDVYLAVSLRPPVHSLGGAFVPGWGSGEPWNVLLSMERHHVAFDALGHFSCCEVAYWDERGTVHEMAVRALGVAWEGPGGYVDMGTGFEMGKPTAHGDSVHVEGEAIAPDALAAYLRERATLGAGSSTTAFYACEYAWGDRVGYGSFEASPVDLAARPNARYRPPTISDEVG
jgi:hypothetical protein